VEVITSEVSPSIVGYHGSTGTSKVGLTTHCSLMMDLVPDVLSPSNDFVSTSILFKIFLPINKLNEDVIRITNIIEMIILRLLLAFI
jgi:hypothetical protein